MYRQSADSNVKTDKTLSDDEISDCDAIRQVRMSGRSEKRGKSIRHCFYDFCKQTILHGWHYLVEGEVTTTSSGANTSSHFGSASPAACRSNQRRTSRDHNCCSCCCRCTCHRGHHNRAYNNGDGGRPQKPQCTNNRFLKCSQGINWAQVRSDNDFVYQS